VSETFIPMILCLIYLGFFYCSRDCTALNVLMSIELWVENDVKRVGRDVTECAFFVTSWNNRLKSQDRTAVQPNPGYLNPGPLRDEKA